MSEESMDLFDTKNDDIVLPEDETFSHNQELMSEGVKSAISGEYVKEILVPEDDTMRLPNYVIDLREVLELTPNQLAVFSSLLTYNPEDTPDTYIYLYAARGVFQIGLARSDKIGSNIALIIEKTIGSEAKVYKDWTESKPGELIKTNDITKIRLNI